MLGCVTNNEGSVKTILKNGGVLSEEKPYGDKEMAYIFWIDLTES